MGSEIFSNFFNISYFTEIREEHIYKEDALDFLKEEIRSTFILFLCRVLEELIGGKDPEHKQPYNFTRNGGIIAIDFNGLRSHDFLASISSSRVTISLVHGSIRLFPH